MTLDATGTLIACPAMPDIYAEVLARHGVATTAASVRRVFPVVWKELDCLTPAGRDRFTSFPGGSRGFWARLVARLCELLEIGEPGPFAAAELFHRFARPDAWIVFPDAVPALDAMRSMGLRLAVISNFDERLPDLLAGLDLARRVDLVVPSSSVGLAKPNPRLFRHVLERLDVEAARRSTSATIRSRTSRERRRREWRRCCSSAAAARPAPRAICSRWPARSSSGRPEGPGALGYSRSGDR